MVAGRDLATTSDQDSSSTSRQSSQGKGCLQKTLAYVCSVTSWFCQFSRPKGQSIEAWKCLLVTNCVFRPGAQLDLLYHCTLLLGSNHVISFKFCAGGVSDNDSEAYLSLVQHQHMLLSAKSSAPRGSEADLAEDLLCPADVNRPDPDANVLHKTGVDELGPRDGSSSDGSRNAQPKQLQSCRAKLNVRQKRIKHCSRHKHRHASSRPYTYRAH